MKFGQMVLDMAFYSVLVCIALVYISDLRFAICSIRKQDLFYMVWIICHV